MTDPDTKLYKRFNVDRILEAWRRLGVREHEPLELDEEDRHMIEGVVVDVLLRYGVIEEKDLER